jgi:hypothetical protein
VEQIEEFIAWKGAFELAYLLENTDDAPYKYEVYDIYMRFMMHYIFWIALVHVLSASRYCRCTMYLCTAACW